MSSLSEHAPHRVSTLRTVGLLAAAALSHWMCGSAAAADVLASRNDDARTGANLQERILNVTSVKNGFGKLFVYDLSAGTTPIAPTVEVYAQPLYVSHIGIPGKGLVNLLLVATMNNVVFAFDADGPKAGTDGVLWKRNLGTPPSIDDVLKNCSIDQPCIDPGGNIRGNLGIMSTPVIDRPRGTVFLVARVLLASGRIGYRLHALDIRTGHDRAGSPVEIQAQVLGGHYFVPEYQNQRAGLALTRGQVIVSWGSYADNLRYYGWVMSYRYDDRGVFSQTGAFVTTPGGSTEALCAASSANNCAHGGIWMSGRAPAVDAAGQVFLMVGNGMNDLSVSAKMNFGNSLLKLDPVSLTVTDFFTPANHLYLNEADLDLGGSGPMIIPMSKFVVGGGKEGVMHVWHGDNLGGFSAGDTGVVQKFSAGKPQSHTERGNDFPGVGVVVSTHAGHIMGGPVYWPRPQSPGGSLLFNWSEDAELRAYAVDPTALQPITVPAVHTGREIQVGHPGGILAISANGPESGSGIVWAAGYVGPTALNEVRPGILRAYSAEDLTLIWSSDANPADQLGSFAKFNPPTVINGRAYMATFSNQLVVYGLLTHNYVRPAASVIPGVLRLLLDDEAEE